MKKVRARIPSIVAARLLFQNRHQCCICSDEPVQIHHIDENPSNNDPENLAVLCLPHHSAATGDEGLGRNYSPQELRLFKMEWEAKCGHSLSNSVDEVDWRDDEESVGLIYSLKKRVVLYGDEHLYHSFELETGDQIDFNLSSSEPIEFLILTKRQYDRWTREGEGTVYEQHTDITELKDSFEVPKTTNWLLLFCNHSDKDVEVWFSVSM